MQMAFVALLELSAYVHCDIIHTKSIAENVRSDRYEDHFQDIKERVVDHQPPLQRIHLSSFLSIQ